MTRLRTRSGRPLWRARLIEEAGGLKRLARKPSGTVQVLGAENALFAHLQGRGPSPKHGVIYTHPAVRHAPRSERGSVARVLAGKLTIAARIDHYRGTLDEAFTTAVLDRLARVRS
jgi:nucleolar protein 56